MKHRYISDSHTHSRCSFDGKDSVCMMCEKATNMGLYSITITDHCECNEYYENDFYSDMDSSINEIARARAMYNGRIRVYTGIELGQPTQDLKASEEALSLADYDFVLGSLHNLKGEQDFYFLEYTPKKAGIYLKKYFDELLDLVQLNNFDSLAHMTYPLRYICGNAGIKVEIADYAEKIDEILTLLIKNRRALEVNTSGLRQMIRKTLPDENIIRRYYRFNSVIWI